MQEALVRSSIPREMCESADNSMVFSKEGAMVASVEIHTRGRENLVVLSACTGNETSRVNESLGYSIFTYFLTEFIGRCCSVPGRLPMKKIFEECQTL